MTEQQSAKDVIVRLKWSGEEHDKVFLYALREFMLKKEAENNNNVVNIIYQPALLE